MTDNALGFTEERNLGKVLGSVRLDSAMPMADGSRSRASLVLTVSGLWLVAARDRFHGVNIDVLTRSDVRLVAGRLRDRLCFAQESLLIPAGRRHAVERLLALGRLGSAARPHNAEIRRSRLVHTPDELAYAWLARALAPAELVICWVPADNRLPLNSQITGEVESRPQLLVTDQRAAFVAISPVGDVAYTPLRAGAVLLRMRGEQAELSSQGSVFLGRRSDAQACCDAFELLGLEPAKARLLEAARRLWLTRENAREEPAHALALLQGAVAQGSVRARFARQFLLAEPHGVAAVDHAELALALSEGALTPGGLTELWVSWKFSEQAGRTLLRGLLDLGAQPFALALQRAIQVTPISDEAAARDELRLARFDVEARLAQAHEARDVALAAVLSEHGLRALPCLPATTSNALATDVIEDVLSHPLARTQRKLVTGAQKLIAQSPEPDHGALSDYCEALDGRAHPEARRALDAARLAFSLPTLHAYVSRGKKSIGLRGYEGKAPYILLGKDHLDTASPFWMSEAELFFAFGAEALHLKLGQTRLTSNEVWAGAFAHTKGGVELLLGLLPLLQGMPLGASAAKALEKVPEPAIRRGLEALVRFERSKRKEPATETASALSHVNEHLLAAHRVMQMSADRAGLVLCGDLRSSLRGMLLVRPDTCTLLNAMIERDIVSVLLDTAERDRAMGADLTVRIAALLAFYVSEDYVMLRRSLLNSPAPH
jgi:hypothetical protein